MNYFVSQKSNSLQIIPIVQQQLESWLVQQPAALKNWVEVSRFKAEPSSVCIVPDAKGGVASVLLGVKNNEDYWSWGSLPSQLPAGVYHVQDQANLEKIALVWGMASYQFTTYKKADAYEARLVVPDEIQQKIKPYLDSIYFARDLINTPTEDLGTAELSQAVQQLAGRFQAQFREIVGEDLLKENFPLVHAVGRASDKPPRLLDLTWGNPDHPKLTFVGKGIVYDTGGLSLKPTNSMKSMKKDMGGAAMALALAQVIMAEGWPVRLRVLLSAAENAIGGNAYRPGDVLIARDGTSVEIGNTDAEGRLVMADALVAACEEQPEWLLNFSTLTGAQRVALGPDVPSFFTDESSLSEAFNQAAKQCQQLVWPLPLYEDYRSFLKSDIADISNVSSEPFGGAITAALFLKHFVKPEVKWCHFDFNGANTRSLPGRPKGGEVPSFLTIVTALKNLLV